MLVSTTTIVAIRCPVCGKIDFQALSLFSFAGKKVHRVICSCGANLMSLGSKDKMHFMIQMDCGVCENQHVYHYGRRQLWSNQLTVLCCEETGLDIGFLGPREQVRSAALKQDKSLLDMAEDLGFFDYFESPEIMYEVLEQLHRIAESGFLSCHCGSYQINVEIYPDRLELRCENCDAIGLFFAENDSDLDAIRGVGEIRLSGNPLVSDFLPVASKGKKRSKK